MIGYLRGIARETSPDRVLLEVGGVGYEVHVPLPTFYEIERAPAGQEVELRIHTHVREDALVLFGFWSRREKTLFELLLGVTGVGPKLARNVLSGASLDDLLAALGQGDVVRLAKIPGLGKKTAERLVLELREKVKELAPEPGAAAGRAAAGPADDTGNLISALVNLGYKAQLAEDAVRKAREDAPEAQFHELLRLSLKRLSRV